MDSKEEIRRIRVRKETIRILRRARRLNECLNKAIRTGDPELIVHWQKLMLPFYEIPYCDWAVSNGPSTNP